MIGSDRLGVKGGEILPKAMKSHEVWSGRIWTSGSHQWIKLRIFYQIFEQFFFLFNLNQFFFFLFSFFFFFFPSRDKNQQYRISHTITGGCLFHKWLQPIYRQNSDLYHRFQPYFRIFPKLRTNSPPIFSPRSLRSHIKYNSYTFVIIILPTYPYKSPITPILYQISQTCSKIKIFFLPQNTLFLPKTPN